MSRAHRRSAAIALAAIASSTIMVGGNVHFASAADDPVIVFYTICDKTPAASTTSDTVKVKRVNEDGTSAVTIGDTGIADCGNGAGSNASFSGFAVAGEYGYFSWFDSTSGGIGRIRLDGTASAEKNFIAWPSGTKYIRLSPTSVGGYLYAYLDKRSGNTGAYVESRIARVATTGGAFTTVVSPVATDVNADSLSFGVGKTAIYFATGATSSKLLEKINFDGTGRTNFFDFADPTNDPTNRMQFLVGQGANLIADSGSKLFLYEQDAAFYDTGISTINASSPDGTRQAYSAVPSNVGQPPAVVIVWGGNYLYFTDAFGTTIGRTTATGTGRNMNVFPTLMTGGRVHHISPALASSVTVTTTTSSTTSTTSSTSSTTSSTSSTTSTTVASATSSTATTAAATTTTTVPTVPKSGLTAARVASLVKIAVPKGARVGLAVAASSRKACAVRGGKLVALSSGDCRVTATVTPKVGKSTRRTVVLKTS